VGGYVLGAITALLTVFAFWSGSGGMVLLTAIFMVAGLYVAVQDTLESTVTAEMVSPDTLTISYGALGAVNGGAKFLSSTVVGALWSFMSPLLGFGLAAGLMLCGAISLRRVPR
jgi:hypothetical protein